MAKNGVLPTNNAYGMLVDVYAKDRLMKESLLWIKHMRQGGVSRRGYDEYSCSSVKGCRGV